MARTFRLENLVARSQRQANLENHDLVSGAEWREILSQQWEELHSVFVDSGMRIYESEETVVSDGSEAYALPHDYLHTLGVDYEYTDGTRLPLPELMVQERNFYTGAASASHAVAYTVKAESLRLQPTPPSGQTYYHVYVPQPQDFRDRDVDVVDDGNNELDILSHNFQTGQGPVQVTTSNTLPTGISASTNYWVRRVSDDAISLHTSQADAESGDSPVTFSDTGTGTHTIESGKTALDVVVPGGEKYLIWGAVMMAQAKGEVNTGLARAERDRYEDLVRWRALQRALVEPRRKIVRDETPDAYGDGWLPGDYIRGSW